MTATSKAVHVVPIVDWDRVTRFAVRIDSYYTSDGHVYATEFSETCDTRAEAEALAGHYRVAA